MDAEIRGSTFDKTAALWVSFGGVGLWRDMICGRNYCNVATFGK